ncbi:MAG: type II toxin-antitoxin system RelE family toxin [Smithella sp.]
MNVKYDVHVTKTVEKDLDDLEPYRARVVSELLALEVEPHKGHALHGKLAGYLALEFSLPGGVCRAVYEVKRAERVCLIIIVGYHEGLYERALQRIKGMKR